MGGPGLMVIDTASHAQRSVEAILDEAANLLAAFESRYSRYRPESLVSLINERAGSGVYTDLDTEAGALFELGGRLWTESEGLFDITSGPLRRVWNFQPAGKAAPDKIDEVLDLVGYGRIEWREKSCHLPRAGMEIDLGGLAKEYAVDCIIRLFKDAAINSALVELAGDTAVIGAEGSGDPWKIGITNPSGPAPLRTVELTDGAIATSGSYERTLTHDGRSYGHLLDPRSGWPVKGPISVTVIDQCCLTAGAIATVACLQHEAKATRWLECSQLPWLMVNSDAAVSGPIARTEPL